MEIQNCLICGKEMKISPSQEGRKKYCSRKCQYKEHERVIKQCLFCGKEIQARKSIQERKKFCSKDCANAYQRERKTKDTTTTNKCPICGKTYLTGTTIAGFHKTCSKKCAREVVKQPHKENKQVEQTCKACKKTFLVYPSRKNTIKYCSPECRTNGKSKEKRKPHKSIVVNCAYCNKKIHVHFCRTKENERHFCNSKCYHAWDSQYKSTPEMHEKLAKRMIDMIDRDTGKAKSSKIEKTVEKWLQDHNLPYEVQKPINNHRVSDFKVKDTFVEVNGCYWHGCSKCFPDPTSEQKRRIGRDKGLQTYCQKNGLSIIFIWEHDIRKNNFQALESLIS